jgi:hypothetical protein
MQMRPVWAPPRIEYKQRLDRKEGAAWEEIIQMPLETNTPKRTSQTIGKSQLATWGATVAAVSIRTGAPSDGPSGKFI